MSVLKTLADPGNPYFAAVISKVSDANLHLANAQVALDPESKKFIEDAHLSVAKAIKAVCVALEKLDKVQGE